MQKTMNLNVRIGGSLSEFVGQNVGEDGSYENVSEYIRDLIRRDKARKEERHFQSLKAELKQAFNRPDSEYVSLNAEDIILRNTK
jgi:putative addiction module CopG family antidote